VITTSSTKVTWRKHFIMINRDEYSNAYRYVCSIVFGDSVLIKLLLDTVRIVFDWSNSVYATSSVSRRPTLYRYNYII